MLGVEEGEGVAVGNGYDAAFDDATMCAECAYQGQSSDAGWKQLHYSAGPLEKLP